MKESILLFRRCLPISAGVKQLSAERLVAVPSTSNAGVYTWRHLEAPKVGCSKHDVTPCWSGKHGYPSLKTVNKPRKRIWCRSFKPSWFVMWQVSGEGS